MVKRLAGYKPSYTETTLSDGSLMVTVQPSPLLGLRNGSSVVRVFAHQVPRYRQWRDGFLMIQEALPDMSVNDREILLSGIGPEDKSYLCPPSNGDDPLDDFD